MMGWSDNRPFLDGKKVTKMMEERGWTIKDLASRVGVWPSIVGRAIHYYSHPRDETVEWLAEALGVKPTDILIYPEDASDEIKRAYQRHREHARMWRKEKEHG